MDLSRLNSDIRGVSDLIRSHVMYQGEYDLKRPGFQSQVTEIIRVYTGIRLDPRIPLNIEILLEEPSYKGLKRILAQGRRDIAAALNTHPENGALRAEWARWTEALEKLK